MKLDEGGRLFARVVAALAEASREQPDAARSRLSGIQEDHDDISIEVVWEREESDGSHHYDALIRHPSWKGTVSIGFAGDDSPPWPLRGVRRWSESDLVKVDETTLQVAEAMAYLDAVWGDLTLQTKLVDLCIVRGELERRALQVEPDEIQAGMDRFRAARGLVTERRTREWMAEHGFTHERLELLVQEQTRLEKLKDLVAASASGSLDREAAFAQWLEKRRAEATIEWFWGPSDTGRP